MGLASDYSIIRRHNGHIAVDSGIGAGTTFNIYLKASSQKIEKKRVSKRKSKVFTGKILVMDDNDMLRSTISSILVVAGNTVENTDEGSKAIKLYKKAMKTGKPFDLVIMDLTIPGGMGGKEAVEKLLKIDPNAHVIVSSGYSNDPVISNYKEYGFCGYIAKTIQR